MYQHKKINVGFYPKRPCDMSCRFEYSHVDVSKWKSEFCFTDPIWSKLLPISSCEKYIHIFVQLHIFSVNLILDFHSSASFFFSLCFYVFVTLCLCMFYLCVLELKVFGRMGTEWVMNMIDLNWLSGWDLLKAFTQVIKAFFVDCQWSWAQLLTIFKHVLG